jgi:hypothetical protein
MAGEIPVIGCMVVLIAVYFERRWPNAADVAPVRSINT